MIFAAGADFHLTNKVPENRKTGYFEEICEKFLELLSMVSTKTDLLVCAGDFFDSTMVPYLVTKEIIHMIKSVNINILVVPGQHDMRYHRSGLNNTPLGVLEESGCVKILGNKWPILGPDTTDFIGAGWNEEPLDKADILVTHRMVTKTGPLFPGQSKFTTAAQMLNYYKWAKIIISGDNHQMFWLKERGRLLVNCGSLVRSSKKQIDHIPTLHFIDSETLKHDLWVIPHKPASVVFDFAKIEKEELKEKKLDTAEQDIGEFIQALSVSDKEQPKFTSILAKVVETEKPNENVKILINTIMEKVGE